MSVTPVLKPFEIVVLKNKDTSPDPTVQVPAAAQVDFYRQGATVLVGATFTSGQTRIIDVYHRGAIKPGDVVQLGTSAETLTVEDEPLPADRRKLKVRYWGEALTLTAGTRLVPMSERPWIYYDPTGDSNGGQSFIITPASDGRGSCYVAALRFDYIVTVGAEKRLYIDADGSFEMRT